MTASRSQPSIAQRLQDHAASDHIRGCMGRQYSCSCEYDATTEKLLVEAAEHIRGLEEALRSMVAEANLLLQNSEGCAVNHYGDSFHIQGMPSWLVDSRKRIEAAAALSHDGPVARDGER